MPKRCLSLCLSILLMVSVSFALAGEERVFRDDTGRDIVLPGIITRMVPSGSTAQMMLYALCPEAFVGLSVPWPKEAEGLMGKREDLPILGQLYGTRDLSIEAMAALHPQVMIDIGERKDGTREDLAELTAMTGIPAIHVDAYLDGFPRAYRMLGELMGVPERGETLALFLESLDEKIEKSLGNVGEDRLTMLYILGDEGLHVTAKNSYHSEIMELVADNEAVVPEPTGLGAGNAVSMEQLLLWNPDVILFDPHSIYDGVGEEPLWQGLDAIREGRYAKTPMGPFNWMGFPPAVQRYLGILWMCDIFYPEAVTYDLYEEVSAYFALFYHKELSREAYDGLMEDSRLPHGLR